MTSLPNGDLLLDNGTVVPMEKRTKTEVYSRVVGYLRPVRQWNKGQKAIWNDRTPYIVPTIGVDEVKDVGGDA